MFLYYVRHGDPIYEPDSLTELGRKQAQALSNRFALYGLDEIYSSTSTRAQMTAEPTAKRLHLPIIPCDWAHEGLVYEDFSVTKEDGARSWVFFNSHFIDLFNSQEVIALGDKWYTHSAFKNERFESGIVRIHNAVDEFMLSFGYKHDRARKRYQRVGVTKRADGEEKRIALFAHQGFGLAFLSSLLDIPYPFFCTHFDISHTGTSVIAFGDDGEFVYPKLLQHSNDSHLYKEGLTTGYNNMHNV
ncbi:MAG: histidine phosphatase family protein [Clostridia bacterium]|nr:histidine phosphatase family protein [Clostridia bacterium]